MYHTMLFSHSKVGHLAQILSSGLLGQIVTHELTPPDPAQIEICGHLIIQVLVGIITIWATIRKAFQKPEAVVKVPANVVPVISGVVAPSASVVPAEPAAAAGDGSAQ